MRNIRGIIIVAAIVAFAFLFGGCTTNVPALPQTETTISAEQVQANEPELNSEDEYIQTIEYLTDFRLTKDEAAIAIELGWATCSLLDEYDEDTVKNGIFQSMAENGINPDSRFGQITVASMVASVHVLCPEYEGAWD